MRGGNNPSVFISGGSAPLQNQNAGTTPICYSKKSSVHYLFCMLVSLVFFFRTEIQKFPGKKGGELIAGKNIFFMIAACHTGWSAALHTSSENFTMK